MMPTLPLEVQARLPAGFQEFLEALVRQFDPEQVVLFGSRARGDAHPDSDTDVLVVMDSSEHPIRTAGRILQQVPSHFPLDLIVTTPARFMATGQANDALEFLPSVAAEGLTVYERA